MFDGWETMKHVINLAICSATALELIGCVSAEVNFRDVELKRTQVTFPGTRTANGPLGGYDASLSELRSAVGPDAGLPSTQDAMASPGINQILPPQTFSYQDEPTVLPDRVNVLLTARRVEIAPEEPYSDLSFLDRVTLTVRDSRNSDSQSRLLLDLAPEVGAGSVSSKVVGSEYSIDPWKASSLLFELKVSGPADRLPVDPWSVTVKLQLRGNVQFHY